MKDASLRKRMIAVLGWCPCCGAFRREENTPKDGIPDRYVYEAVFGCGAAAFISDDNEFDAGRACPSTLENALQNLQQEVEVEIEAEDVQDEGDQP